VLPGIRVLPRTRRRTEPGGARRTGDLRRVEGVGGTPSLPAVEPGGRFKGPNPTVVVELPLGGWVEGAHLVTLGRPIACDAGSQFADSGAGKPVCHGGPKGMLFELLAGPGRPVPPPSHGLGSRFFTSTARRRKTSASPRFGAPIWTNLRVRLAQMRNRS
jgi:hypothetical protein